MALVLFSMGGLFALYEGISKLRDPHEVENLAVAIGILVFAICLESFSLRTAYKEAKHHKAADDLLVAVLRESKQPELPVVLLEDIGAEIGLFFALGGVILASTTGEPPLGRRRLDRRSACCSSIIAIVLAIEMKGLLIGESASDTDQDTIERSLGSAPGVSKLINVRTQHLGPDELLVAAKIEFTADLSIPELAAAINGAEQALRAAVPTARHVFIEPDIYRATAT